MRIISKFHDYYDTVQGLGFDSSLTFIRERKRFDPRAYVPKEISEHMATGYSVETCRPADRRFVAIERCAFTVLFCGSIYRGIRIEALTTPMSKAIYCYSEQKYRSELAALGYKAKQKKAQRWWVVQNKFKNSADYFAATGKADCALFEFAIANRITSAIFTDREQRWMGFGDDETKLVYNPPLKDISFYQVKPVVQAYQDLEMYLGSVLGAPERPIIAITDKDRIQQHGFDKWSFRKMPERKAA